MFDFYIFNFLIWFNFYVFVCVDGFFFIVVRINVFWCWYLSIYWKNYVGVDVLCDYWRNFAVV